MRRVSLGLAVFALTLACKKGESSNDPEQGSSELPMAPEMPDGVTGREVSPEEGGFSVIVPPTANEVARSVEGNNHLAYETETPDGQFRIEVIVVPGGIMNPEQFLERMRESVAQGGEVSAEQTIDVEGNPGWSLRMLEAETGDHLRVDVIVARHHAFLLMYGTQKPATLEDPMTQAFFATFTPKRTTGISRSVRSVEAGFEVTFPEACGPAYKRLEMVNSKVFINYVSESKGQAQCMTSVARVDPLPAEQVLDAGADGIVSKLAGATVDKRNDDMLDGNPRRSLRLHATVDGVTLHVRVDFVYAEQSLYQVQYITQDPAELDDPAVEAYFASFTARGT